MRGRLIWFATLAALTGTGQTARYEVSSIRPSGSDGQSQLRLTVRGGLSAKNVSLLDLIGGAYTLPRWRIIAHDPWVGKERFDIEAKGPEAKEPISGEQAFEMLRSLLAVRFQLMVHRERREHQLFALVVGSNGPKLKQANPAACFVVTPTSKPEDMKGLRACEGFYGRGGDLTGLKVTTGMLANQMASIVGTVVQDETGLSDHSYDVHLQWDPTDQMATATQTSSSDTASPPPPTGPSLFTALQEQLGLRLESRKGPVEFLIVDQAKQPDDN